MVAKMTTRSPGWRRRTARRARPPLWPKTLLRRFWVAVFQARAATRPKAVVMKVATLSRTSAVNDLSFGSLWAVAGAVFRPAFVDGAVLGVGLEEVLHRLRAPAHDHLLRVRGELGADVGLAADAAADVLPGGLAGGAFEALGIEEPARRPLPDHQQVHP